MMLLCGPLLGNSRPREFVTLRGGRCQRQTLTRVLAIRDTTVVLPPSLGPIIVGFGPLTEATSKTNAGSMARTSNRRSQLGATHSKVLGVACHAQP